MKPKSDNDNNFACTSVTNQALRYFLADRGGQSDGLDIPDLNKDQARELIKRIDDIPLYAHAYAFHLNFKIGNFTLRDALNFAHENGLKGLKIHVSDGEERSLEVVSKEERQSFGADARKLDLDLHIETSATDKQTLNQLVEIGLQTGATSVRFYPRNTGPLSEVKAQTIEDLKHLFNLDPEGKLRFTFEQHEDLKSAEIIEIIKAVGHPRLSALFDFGNSVNAYEKPEDALAGMGDYLTEVHAKDIRVIPDGDGWAHEACQSGQGDINIPGLLFNLLSLGDDKPQVTAIGLEEEVDYYAPAFRFPDEGDDPYIPFRDISETPLPEADVMHNRLMQEKEDAQRQVDFIKTLLKQMCHLLQKIENAS